MASGLGYYANLAVAVAGIYTCYLAYGIYQEELYRKDAGDGTKFSATAFVLFTQCATNAAVAILGELLLRTVFSSGSGATAAAAAAATAGGGSAASGKDKKKHEAEHGSLWSKMVSLAVIRTAAVYVLAMYSSNEALAFVSYPTQALVKSCKMIPVMVGSILVGGKRYSLLKYVCVALMTAGITWFQFASDKKKGGSGDGKHGGGGAAAGSVAGFGGESLGMLLLCVSLALDGAAGPLQVRCFQVPTWVSGGSRHAPLPWSVFARARRRSSRS